MLRSTGSIRVGHGLVTEELQCVLPGFPLKVVNLSLGRSEFKYSPGKASLTSTEVTPFSVLVLYGHGDSLPKS